MMKMRYVLGAAALAAGMGLASPKAFGIYGLCTDKETLSIRNAVEDVLRAKNIPGLIEETSTKSRIPDKFKITSLDVIVNTLTSENTKLQFALRVLDVRSLHVVAIHRAISEAQEAGIEVSDVSESLRGKYPPETYDLTKAINLNLDTVRTVTNTSCIASLVFKEEDISKLKSK